MGEIRIKTETGKGRAVLNEPEPESRRSAQTHSVLGVRGKHLQLNICMARPPFVTVII
jgi:hypothetical protein